MQYFIFRLCNTVCFLCIVDCAALNELKLRADFLVIILTLFPVLCYFPSRLSPRDLPPVIDLSGENFSIYIPMAFGLFKLLPSEISLLCICLSYLKWTDWQL